MALEYIVVVINHINESDESIFTLSTIVLSRQEGCKIVAVCDSKRFTNV
jgi:hypothetical protein